MIHILHQTGIASSIWMRDVSWYQIPAPLVSAAPTKTRASVVWFRRSQPKHVRPWFGVGGPNQNTSQIQHPRRLTQHSIHDFVLAGSGNPILRVPLVVRDMGVGCACLCVVWVNYIDLVSPVLRTTRRTPACTCSIPCQGLFIICCLCASMVSLYLYRMLPY